MWKVKVLFCWNLLYVSGVYNCKKKIASDVNKIFLNKKASFITYLLCTCSVFWLLDLFIFLSHIYIIWKLFYIFLCSFCYFFKHGKFHYLLYTLLFCQYMFQIVHQIFLVYFMLHLCFFHTCFCVFNILYISCNTKIQFLKLWFPFKNWKPG